MVHWVLITSIFSFKSLVHTVDGRNPANQLEDIPLFTGFHQQYPVKKNSLLLPRLFPVRNKT